MKKMLILDVDGVLTDGTKAYGPDGKVLWKRFCDHDFTAIKKFQMDGWVVVWLSADETVNRAVAADRGIEFCYSREPDGTIDKVKWLGFLCEKHNVFSRDTVYVGDDMLDIPVMKAIKVSGGQIYCPSGAVPQVMKIVDGVLGKAGGSGAIMDLYYCHFRVDDNPPAY